MNKHACEVLEFQAIRRKVADECWSDVGATALEREPIRTDGGELDAVRARVRRFRFLLTGETEIPRLDFPDVDEPLARARRRGAVLEPDELSAVARFTRSSGRLKRFLTDATDELVSLGDGGVAARGAGWAESLDRTDDPLAADAGRLVEREDLVAAILRIVDETGLVREDEIPELLAIRRAINRLRREIDRFARDLVGGSRDWFQSDVPTERDGRTVLALKANHRGKVKGVVHESSGTGATVYVEPLEVVERNNRIVAEQNRYRQELLRLLRELSERVVAVQPELLGAVAAVAALDVDHARARFSIRQQAQPARIGSELALFGARHPLLGTDAVPVTIVVGTRARLTALSGFGDASEPSDTQDADNTAKPADLSGAEAANPEGANVAAGLSDAVESSGDADGLATGSEPATDGPTAALARPDTRALLITGPNTGGKTVALKTAGLLALMNQFGLDIPVEQRSALPIFDDVFADIGDEQSIEQSLSTYSGHIRTIAEILDRATERSLVLLDELGSGTDPEEGVSVAMALLDTFLERGCQLIATTHHGVLKSYGYTRDAVENASMEFDQQTLAPTFRVLHGIPGESHALEIAAHHGIPDDVIKRARSYLSDERSDAGEIVRRLSEKEHEIARESREQAQQSERLRESRRQAALKELQLKQAERQLRDDGLKALAAFRDDARSRLENLVREIRESGGSVDTGAVHEFTQALDERLGEENARRQAVDAEVAALDGGEDEDRGPLAVGDRVRIRSTGASGVILRRGRKGQWTVEAGAVRMQVGESDLAKIEPSVSDQRNQRRDRINVSVDAAERVTETQVAGRDDLPSTMPAASSLFELHVRGMRFNDAIARVERHIDTALLKGVTEFAVVHGKGEGVLRRGVQDFLRQSALVESYETADAREGGFGKTIVRLKG